ncbi:MAG: response regulator [Phycisphaerales bacterium]|nr:response regulator [Phycisphaerales bacterium]MCB9856446.1 response regulator [Phycisphaerales bacterium]
MLSQTRKRVKPAVVLLVEDDLADQELTRRALVEDVVRVDLQIVNSGSEAMAYLQRRGKYANPLDSPRPDMILLDLNLPGMSGREVLQAIRKDPALKNLVVVVLTTSEQDADITNSYDLHCHSFVTKPVNVNRFLSIIRDLGRYWFELVTLPPV